MNLHLIKKKWYIILACAVLCAGGLYFEKSHVKPVIPQSGDMTYIKVVKFNQLPIVETNKDSIEVQMNSLVGAWPNLSYLEEKVNTKFDMIKLNPYWNNLSQSQKFGWLAAHFRINRIGPGMYELIFQMGKSDVKDAQYIEENSKQFMNTYEAYFQKAASLAISNTELITVREFKLVENVDIPTTKDIEKKYAIIGFILGGLVGIVLVTAIDAIKNRRKISD